MFAINYFFFRISTFSILHTVEQFQLVWTVSHHSALTSGENHKLYSSLLPRIVFNHADSYGSYKYTNVTNSVSSNTFNHPDHFLRFEIPASPLVNCEVLAHRRLRLYPLSLIV